MRSFWIGVASRQHVLQAVGGGYCQLSHGKKGPVLRLTKGDVIVFYSPHDAMGDYEPLQTFTAVGEIKDDFPHQTEQAKDFHPFRRMVKYFKASATPIRPLLSRLSFTEEKDNWGTPFRRGSFKISGDDFSIIAIAMRVPQATLQRVGK